MRKNTLIILSFFILLAGLKGQEKIVLNYNLNWEITTKDNAKYYRECQYDLSNFVLNGKVLDYNFSDTTLMEGNYSSGKKNGVFVFYYDNGKIKSKGKYENDKRIGYWKYYYENGQIKQTILFRNCSYITDFAVVEYYDINGKQWIKNGKGKWRNDSIQEGSVGTSYLTTVTGNFKDSLKHGNWKSFRITDNKMMLQERFRKGKFVNAIFYNPRFNNYGSISGETIKKIPDENIIKFHKTEMFKLDELVFPKSLLLSDVKTIFKTITGKSYKTWNREAGYKYGDYDLFQFIAKNTIYPTNAMDQDISGKVYVRIVIDSIGNTKEVKLHKGVQKDLDQEALRVAKLINDWLPAIHNGEKVEAIITIPINFLINE